MKLEDVLISKRQAHFFAVSIYDDVIEFVRKLEEAK